MTFLHVSMFVRKTSSARKKPIIFKRGNLKMKKFVELGLAMSMGLSLTACGGSGSGSAPQGGGDAAAQGGSTGGSGSYTLSARH